MFSSLSLGLLLIPLVSAKTIDVQVGGDGGSLLFSPEATFADIGDQVVFHFNPKNHSVTQSSFASPCGKKEGGADSGFMPVAANSTDAKPTWTYTVQDQQATWFYCAQAANQAASHCGAGMVFSVNCPADDNAPNSFSKFKASAMEIGKQLKAQESGSGGGYGGGYGGGAATNTWTAAYGDVTVPPVSEAQVVTQVVTLNDQVWTTTYSSYPGSPAPTPASAEGRVHKVIVGGTGKLAFDPPQVQAAVRDTIVFEFHQKNHSVVQSSFADPCRKLDANGMTGFTSGFMAVEDGATTFPTWNMTVNDTTPIWAYCSQKLPSPHCGSGMVFAVNPVETSERSFSAFQQLAQQLNGTAAAAIAAPSASASDTPNAAPAVRVTGAGLTLAFAAAVAVLL